MKKLVYIFLLSLSLLLTNCGGNSNNKNKVDSLAKVDTNSDDNQLRKTVNHNRKFDDIARFLACLPAENGSPFTSYDSITAYKTHVEKFNQSWKEMEQKRMQALRKWRDEEINPKINQNLNCFYPFSGPDFLHAYEFFPKAKKYLFFAGEQVGALPDFEKNTKEKNLRYNLALGKSMQDIFTRSYYITQYMGRDLPQIDGTVTTFMVYLVRTGHSIDNIEFIGIDSTGKSFVRTEKQKYVNGVRFYFHPTNNGNDARILEYFNTDISDLTEKTKVSGLSKNPGVVKYIKAFGKSNTFVKAASYLMHYETFSIIRETTKSISESILEDDTGIPYKFLKDNYDVNLYGTYVRPIANFSLNEYQRDLAELYKVKENVKPLPISLGYHVKDGNQNYLLFTKKK